jgi:NAD(P)-dependent dehydrogenase (short-subunit alcohol dehydrogenase family)
MQMAPSGGIVYDQAALEHHITWRRYGQAKLANILHARALQNHYPTITATSVHPGVILTDLYTSAKASLISRVGMMMISPMTLDVPGGAKNSLWAATAPKETVRASYYYTPVGKKNGGSFWHAQKPKLAEDLWKWTENELVSVTNQLQSSERQ